jgi:RNA polymerase sigma-70 factor, ECF subfamily
MLSRRENQRENLEDTELVLLATLGSFPAFDELIRRYRGPITLAAEQVIGSRAVAEEVAQETFLAAFRALPSLEAPGAVGGWLRAIARNFALKILQKERRCTATDDLDALVQAASAELAIPPDWVRRIEHEIIFQALQKLPEDQQEVLYLVAYEDWSVARIAEYLTVPEATVRGRLYRARQAVRQYYNFSEETK